MIYSRVYCTPIRLNLNFVDENTFDDEDAEMLRKADQEWEAMNTMEETPWDPNYPDIEQKHYP